MAATTTLGAITELFDSDATLSEDFAQAGGLWQDLVPEDRPAVSDACPHVVLKDFHEAPTDFYPNVRVEQGAFEFVVYAVKRPVAEALASDIRGLFDPSSSPRAPQQPAGQLVLLPIENTTRAWVKRRDYRVRTVEYRTADGSLAWEVTMPYETVVIWQV